MYSIRTYNPYAQEYNIISQQVKILNIETNELTTLDIPESIKLENLIAAIDNNNLIISIRDDDDLLLYQYNIGQKRWLDPVTITFPVNGVFNSFSSFHIQATNGKIYLITQVEQGSLLQILDIENYQPLYEGIMKKDSKQKSDLYIYRVHESNE